MLSVLSLDCRDGKPHKLFSKQKGMQSDSDDRYLANLNINRISINEIAMAGTMSKVEVADLEDQTLLKDNGGRRIGVDRRSFSYSLYIPERRSHDDRRADDNRRKKNRMKSKSPFISSSYRSRSQ